jgi:hypothetical protein
VDAYPTRVKNGLRAIKARFLGEKVSLLQPHICQISMPSIDLNLNSNQRTTIVFNGYDIADLSLITMALVKKNGEELSLADRGARQTNYQFTIRLTGLDDNLLKSYDHLSLKFEGKEFSRLGITPFVPIDPGPPKQKDEIVDPPKITVIPQLVHGDPEYYGCGPIIDIGVFFTWTPQAISLKVTMQADESNCDVSNPEIGNRNQGDWTSAYGEKSMQNFYNAPSGWHIKSIKLPQLEWHIPYIDRKGAIKPYTYEDQIGTFIITGDLIGDDIGRTGVTVTFKYFVVVLEENR